MERNKHLKGLNDQQVSESREKNGVNSLTQPKEDPIWKLFLEKFKDPIIVILLIALVLCMMVSVYQYLTGLEGIEIFFEPLGIFVAILLATCIGFVFEYNANSKFKILNQVNDDTMVKVIRNSNVSEIPKKDLVVGDIVLLETGEEVPADGELIEAISLHVNESTLTGEPIIEKTVKEEDFDKDATYPSNYVLRSTTVVDGHGTMEVKAVGDATEYGEVYKGSKIDNQIKTPLNIQLEKLSKLITFMSYAFATLIIIGRLALYFGRNTPFDWISFGGYLLNTVMIAVTIIVVAVPEGLPMSVTLSLAMSMKRMLKTNNLVRKMHACETMGSATVICTDKTGTLTENQMRISETKFYGLRNQELKNDNELSELIKEAISVNTTAFLDREDPQKVKVLGNPTEGALLFWLDEHQTDYLYYRENTEILEQLTFSTERKYMATIVRSNVLKKNVLYVKGAPEIVLGLSRDVLTDEGEKPVASCKESIEEQLYGYQKQAMRTLGFAFQILEDETPHIVNGKLYHIDLTYLGIVAISDPIRKEVPDAVKTCLNAGILVKIVTGDTPGTAVEIGKQIGLWKPEDSEWNHMTGSEFAATDDNGLLERVMDLKIMSRARPTDKSRLVKLLQKKGQIVAVTGDGTNDAPALKAAQVGLSMGDGTSVAKEASAITILDNSFASITRAIMWGRSLYKNIQRFLLFQMTINLVACMIVLIGAFIGTQSPLTVTQMLWVNLIMDTFAALALASLPPNEEVMKEKPRDPQNHIINQSMIKEIIGVGIIFILVLFGFLQYFKHYDITALSQFNLHNFIDSFFRFRQISTHPLSTYELSLFFSLFVLLQFWNMFNAKAFDTGKSAFHFKNCQAFLFTSLIILIGQIVIVSVGKKMFNVTPIQLTDWIILIASTSLVLWIGEIKRFIFNINRNKLWKTNKNQ